MTLSLYSYNQNSEGANALAAGLGIKKISHQNSRFRGRPDKTVINWGASTVPEEVLKCNILNHPSSVHRVSNKLDFFRTVSDSVSVPPWTDSKDEAFSWVEDGAKVMARTVLNGSNGDGIVIMHKDDIRSLTDARLYTKYIPKQDEYRIHVFNGEVIDVQRKAIRPGWLETHEGEKPNFLVRNHANGFIYVRHDVSPPSIVLEQSRKAVEACGLTFGAVDCIFNNKRQAAFILEVNSAPGLQGSTVETYINKFKELI